MPKRFWHSSISLPIPPRKPSLTEMTKIQQNTTIQGSLKRYQKCSWVTFCLFIWWLTKTSLSSVYVFQSSRISKYNVASTLGFCSRSAISTDICLPNINKTSRHLQIYLSTFNLPFKTGTKVRKEGKYVLSYTDLFVVNSLHTELHVPDFFIIKFETALHYFPPSSQFKRP